MPPKPPMKLPRTPPHTPTPFNAAKQPYPIPISPYKPSPQKQPASANPSPPPPPPPHSPPRRPSLLKRPVQILTGFVTLILLRDNLASIDSVRGSSMAPTLSPDSHEQGKSDWVIIRKWRLGGSVIGDREDIQRGDVVTFWKPHREEEISIKRVVAVEGDLVRVMRGYGVEGILVPYNHIWVEGDNWRKSYDSNDFGPVSKALIDGKAVRVWRNGWWREIGDGREERRQSRVVEGVGMPLPTRYMD
ncbi:LexA/Signal peptidase [Amniculicola lignicola CBS 123094]|uniref:Mitochondrial inner membrane protease subunit n=1 Tax=Amniculicola lignicola CBS 123094 TaxID=1392246 RepID=A0A6A5W0R4_9PLEO|nr:LexA/Signal peptidase [Amniculicola lignicola CBS 123094]